MAERQGEEIVKKAKHAQRNAMEKVLKGLLSIPPPAPHPPSNSTSFSLISGLAPQGQRGQVQTSKEPESFTRPPAHTPACIHTCAHTLIPTSSLSRAAGVPTCTQTFCQTASKTITEAESKAPWTFTLLSFSPLSC